MEKRANLNWIDNTANTSVKCLNWKEEWGALGDFFLIGVKGRRGLFSSVQYEPKAYN